MNAAGLALTEKEAFAFRPAAGWGLRYEGLFPGAFCRIDPAALPGLPPEVQRLAQHTAGAGLRFQLAGRRFAVRLRLGEFSPMPHMPLTGQAGLDVYCDAGGGLRFWQNLRPEPGETLVQAACELPRENCTVQLYLPLYAPVEALELGLPPGGAFAAPPPRAALQPLVFYGSSITQGACAARPGSSYAALLARMAGCGMHNLGFSGNCLGEPALADIIAALPMCAFIYDYDHNAPSAAHLARTHAPFLQRLLARRPELAVLVVSRPDFGRGGEDAQRRAIVLETYTQARRQGAKIEFVDGAALFGGLFPEECTVDGIHPTDLGCHRMARAIYPALCRLLGLAPIF